MALKEAELPAGAIVEELDDGGVVRNDRVVLRPAKENPWYVLATIFGEQADGASRLHHDKQLAEKNRRVWNGWYCGGLSEEERKNRAKEIGVAVAELEPLLGDEYEKVLKLFQARMGDASAELPDVDGKIEFGRVYFATTTNFMGFYFANECDFIKAHFAKNALFASTKFGGNTFFIKTEFKGHADFRHATFALTANFRMASFDDAALFSHVTFVSNSCFASTTFYSGVSFAAAFFKGSTDFERYEYNGLGFYKAPYPARFFGAVDFCKASFEARTMFSDAKFLRQVPEFHAAELYDDTVFTLPDDFRENWPPLEGVVTVAGCDEPVEVMDADEQKRAYNRLRLFMNRSLQIDEEQFFHRMEMRCKMVKAKRCESRWCNLINMYWWYAVVSDFGHSVKRPVCGVLGLIVLGWPLMIYHLLDSSGIISSKVFFKAGGWSIANSLPFLGFGKLYYGAKFAGELTTFLKVIGGFQTLMGFVLLFFLGLGLRNRFRLR